MKICFSKLLTFSVDLFLLRSLNTQNFYLDKIDKDK